MFDWYPRRKSYIERAADEDRRRAEAETRRRLAEIARAIRTKRLSPAPGEGE